MEQFVSAFEQLTESEKRIFTYIYKNQAKAASMKIQELADAALVSKTVVINMCQKLGFEGFGDLKYYLKNNRSGKVGAGGGLSLADLEFGITDQVKRTMALVSAETLQKAAKRILCSKTVYLVGRGTSKAVAGYFEHKLLIMGIKCINLQDYNLIAAVTKNIEINETVVVISLSGETEKALEVARIAKARDAAVISVTGFSTNTLSKIADISLFCAADLVDTRHNDTNSRIGMFVLIDLLGAFIQNKGAKSIFHET